MNLKKILAVVLSMTLLVSCLVSGMSLNTSATTIDQETAKTQLTDAWGKMSKTPEVVFENFVENNSGWTDKTSNSTYDSNIGANVYTATADKGLILVTGAYNNPTKWANFNNYDEIYFYYSNPKSNCTFAPDVCTESGSYGNYTLAGPDITLNQTADANLVKFDLKTAAINASGYKAENYYATGTEKRAMFRLRFGSAPTDLTISQVLGVKPTVVPDTAGKKLGDVIALAEAEDLTQYEDNDAKTAFQTALADAKKVMLRNPDDAIAYITEAWKKVENKSEVVFSSFYDKRTGSWSENASVTDVVIQGDAVKVFNTTNNNLIIMAPGATDVNQPTESINIELYDEIYLYYKSTDKSYSNVQYPSYKTDGTVAGKYSTTLSQTTGDEYYKFDIKNDIISRPDYGSNKDYYNGTTGKWFRLHFGNNDVTTALSISQVYGVKKLDLAAEFDDAFTGQGEDVTANSGWKLADWMEAYTKYDIENKYDADELVAAVEDVKAANPAVRIYSEGIFDPNKISGGPSSHVYFDELYNTTYTSYRVIASYICPMVEDQPQLNKIRVYGKDYELVSRKISIWRENYSDDPKTSTAATDEALQKCWNWTDNGDGTATVQYSLYLKKIPKIPAENNNHIVNAEIIYDCKGTPVKVTCDEKNVGTVKDAHIRLNPNAEWFTTTAAVQ